MATERLLEAGIAPRWQLFLTKRCLNELNEFIKLISDLKLHERCSAIGQHFDFFIGGMSPEGSGYDLDSERLEFEDLALVPDTMASASRDRLEMLGRTESELYNELIKKDSPANMGANVKSISINADYDVYPNIAEPTEWWKLGNLKTDGVDKVIKTYLNGTTPGMTANRIIPISELTRRYGDKNSKKLYDKGDLVCRFMHQWGVDSMKTV